MSDTGRYYIKDEKTGRVFCVEPISNSNHAADWGDVHHISKKLTGKYGSKYKGAICEEESIIKEGEFKNITTLKAGESPEDYINNLLENKNYGI